MIKNIVFIMSDSEAYLRDEVLRISKGWGFSKSNVRTVEDWSPALARGATSLFGEVSMVHLDLSDNNKLRSFVKYLNDKKNKEYLEGDWFGPGLIITSTHARGAKRIENVVKSSGGDVQKKAKPEEMKKILMKRVALNKESKDFLNAYVGDDYQIMIGVVNQLEKLKKKDQRELTVEELVVRLPGKPGSLPPWEFVNPMLEGNAKEAVSLYERAVEGSHVLVTMTLARSKLQLLYRLKLLQAAGVWKSQEQAKIVGERNGPNVWITAKTAQRLDIETAEYLAKLALATEANLKGHSNADPHVLFKNFIVAACLAIRYNRVLPLKIR